MTSSALKNIRTKSRSTRAPALAFGRQERRQHEGRDEGDEDDLGAVLQYERVDERDAPRLPRRATPRVPSPRDISRTGLVFEGEPLGLAGARALEHELEEEDERGDEKGEVERPHKGEPPREVAELRRCERRPRPALLPFIHRAPEEAAQPPLRRRSEGDAPPLLRAVGVAIRECVLVTLRGRQRLRVAHAVGGDAARQVGGDVGRAHHSLGGGGARAVGKLDALLRRRGGDVDDGDEGGDGAGRPARRFLRDPTRRRRGGAERRQHIVKPRSKPFCGRCSCSGSSNTVRSSPFEVRPPPCCVGVRHSRRSFPGADSGPLLRPLPRRGVAESEGRSAPPMRIGGGAAMMMPRRCGSRQTPSAPPRSTAACPAGSS